MLHQGRCTFLIISRSVLLILKMFQTKVVEKIKTHILCSVTFFFCPKNLAVYKITWKSMVEADRPQMTIYTAHAHCMLDN